jgi:hypothetical protein
MTAFFDLYLHHSSPLARTDPGWADRHFPALVARSPFHLWKPGDPVEPRGLRLLLGTATWSGYDMRLLDLIVAALTSSSTAFQGRVDVFNTAECKQPEDFRAYIPTLGFVHHTPVVGVWKDGRLEEAKQGYEGRDLAARMFGSSSQEIVASVQERLATRSS